MICPSCQTENRDTARFCDNCGTQLQVTCPNCGTANRPGAKFCDNCGQALKAGSRAVACGRPQLSILDRLIPRDLAAKLEAARRSGTMEGERRVVTILFSDVVGSTSASEQLDPEEWTEIMNEAFEHMIAPVYLYEGNVARLMGDAILAFFGAPIAHEDDPRRAVLASLDIVENVKAYQREVSRLWGVDFQVRVGINTGLVVVGAVGSDLRMEYTAMGDAINLAARMEQTAAPGTVQIAEDTYAQVSPFFELQELGGIVVKGKLEQVQAYRVLGRKATPGRLRGIEGLNAPLIGRQREQALLTGLISEIEDKGSGAIVCLTGEAGLDKSRLISELADAARADLQWIETASLSYEGGRPPERPYLANSFRRNTMPRRKGIGQ